jgi:hypothetical protein
MNNFVWNLNVERERERERETMDAQEKLNGHGALEFDAFYRNRVTRNIVCIMVKKNLDCCCAFATNHYW